MGSSTSEIAYAELRCKTCYSFLEGASQPEELIDRAAVLGLRALALTDRGGVYGVPKAYRASKHHPALKLIVGAEVPFDEDRPPITLLARDRAAYGLLCRTLTAAHADRPKGEPVLRWLEFLSLMERPESRGLVALPEPGPRAEIATLRDVFSDRLFLPVSRHLDGLDRQRLERARELAREHGCRLVAVNDVRAHLPDRRKLQDVFTALRHRVPLSDAGRRLHSNAERYLKSPARMARLFADLPDALRATVDIAESCVFSPSELRYRYPSEWIPAGETAHEYLTRLTCEGAARRYPAGAPDAVRRQLAHELGLIGELGFADYFLTIWEIVEFARGRGILCQGRGSAANSAVCYCLGITAIDPVRMNLLFERFISAERGEPPDIDVDFEHERREEVLQHVYEKYGRDRAAMVSAVITYRSRLAVREVCKALEEDLDAPSETALALAREVQGFPRHLSIHSGGFTLSADPILETVPVEPARMEGRTIVQWDKDDLDSIGLLKVDLLALGMLSALHRCFDLVREASGRQLSIAAVPAEDEPTYEMIRRADTVGTFQVESRAQMSMLPRLLPRCFYDLVVQVAIVRPGPIVGKMVHPYLRRRRGEEKPDIPHPALEPILGKTLGVPLFQEQVMKMAVALGGFTSGEADELRRAIGSWRSRGSVDRLGKKLMEGLLHNGLPQEFVDRVFQQIQGFAEYGFPESHAASFALIAYASCYVKCHHPAEFLCALVNSQPLGFYSVHTLVEDARRHGVRVLPVDPNRSTWDCGMEGTSVRLGWRVVRGLARAEADGIVACAAERPFTSLSDFLSRARVRRDRLEELALAGAFECFGLDRRGALWAILHQAELLRPGSPGGWRAADGQQLSLFSVAPEVAAGAAAPAPFAAMTDLETIHADYATYGLSLRGHPMQALRRHWKSIPPGTTRGARESPHGRSLAIAGLVIVRQRPPTAKGTCFATLEDEDGFLDLIFHARVFERFQDVFWSSAFLKVRGRIQRDGLAVNLIVSGLEPLREQRPGRAEPPRAPGSYFQKRPVELGPT